MNNIITAFLCFAFVGGLLGLFLAVLEKKLSVNEDLRIAEITGLLPGVNCGGCGFTGCAAFASALIGRQAATSGCALAAENAAAIAGIAGDACDIKVKRYRARVMCSGMGKSAGRKYIYGGIADCAAAARLGGGPRRCPDGCMGFGSCEKSCKFGAISVRDGLAVINPDKCLGCGACVSGCPKGLIKLVPDGADYHIACRSAENGAAVRSFCNAGCIGCGICQRSCEYGAIKKDGSLFEIDCEKCTGCGACAVKCPRKIIRSEKGEAVAASLLKQEDAELSAAQPEQEDDRDAAV